MRRASRAVLGLALPLLSACATPRALAVATSEERARDVAESIYAHDPAARAEKLGVAVVRPGDAGAVADLLRRALARGVRFVGVDGAAGKPSDLRVSSALADLRLQGVAVGWVEIVGP